MREVLDKAESPGYVSQYSPKALRATALSNEEGRSLDKNAIAAQMSQSFMNDQYNQGVRANFQDRFNQSIDAIHNAQSTQQQDAAIAQFNQTAAEFNTAELAERDNFGGHATDAQGQVFRAVPKSVTDPNTGLAVNTAAAPVNGQFAPSAAPVNGQAAPTAAPVNGQFAPTAAPVNGQFAPTAAPVNGQTAPSAAPVNGQAAPTRRR